MRKYILLGLALTLAPAGACADRADSSRYSQEKSVSSDQDRPGSDRMLSQDEFRGSQSLDRDDDVRARFDSSPDKDLQREGIWSDSRSNTEVERSEKYEIEPDGDVNTSTSVEKERHIATEPNY